MGPRSVSSNRSLVSSNSQNPNIKKWWQSLPLKSTPSCHLCTSRPWTDCRELCGSHNRPAIKSPQNHAVTKHCFLARTGIEKVNPLPSKLSMAQHQFCQNIPSSIEELWSVLQQGFLPMPNWSPTWAHGKRDRRAWMGLTMFWSPQQEQDYLAGHQFLTTQQSTETKRISTPKRIRYTINLIPIPTWAWKICTVAPEEEEFAKSINFSTDKGHSLIEIPCQANFQSPPPIIIQNIIRRQMPINWIVKVHEAFVISTQLSMVLKGFVPKICWWRWVLDSLAYQYASAYDKIDIISLGDKSQCCSCYVRLNVLNLTSGFQGCCDRYLCFSTVKGVFDALEDGIP